MLAMLLLLWTGLGLLVAGRTGRTGRAKCILDAPWLRARPRAAAALRALGGCALVASVVPAARELGYALGGSTALLGAMCVASVAVVVASLRPKLYVASVLLSAVAATASV